MLIALSSNNMPEQVQSELYCLCCLHTLNMAMVGWGGSLTRAVVVA